MVRKILWFAYKFLTSIKMIENERICNNSTYCILTFLDKFEYTAEIPTLLVSINKSDCTLI